MRIDSSKQMVYKRLCWKRFWDSGCKDRWIKKRCIEEEGFSAFLNWVFTPSLEETERRKPQRRRRSKREPLMNKLQKRLQPCTVDLFNNCEKRQLLNKMTVLQFVKAVPSRSHDLVNWRRRLNRWRLLNRWRHGLYLKQNISH